MGRIGGKEHEELLKKTIEQMENDGYRVIDLKGRSPDAIAVKDDKIIAIEILGETRRHGKWQKSWTYIQKEDDYKMFDEIIIKTFKRGNYVKD